MLRLILGIQVVERAEELVEAMRGGQVLVEVAEVVLAKLPRLVALRLEPLGERHIARLQAFLRAGQADLEQAGAETALPGNERGAAGGAALDVSRDAQAIAHVFRRGLGAGPVALSRQTLSS